MSSELLLPLLLFLVLPITVVVVYAVVAYARGEPGLLRRLRRLPRLAAREIVGRGAIARVTGRIVAVGEPLRAPLSGRPCV